MGKYFGHSAFSIFTKIYQLQFDEHENDRVWILLATRIPEHQQQQHPLLLPGISEFYAESSPAAQSTGPQPQRVSDVGKLAQLSDWFLMMMSCPVIGWFLPRNIYSDRFMIMSRD